MFNRRSYLYEKAIQATLLLLISYVLTMTLQYWIGEKTIYGKYEASKIRLHTAILHNTLPSGQTWQSMGANATNVRIGVVIIAELVHEKFGISIPETYKMIDTVCLFLIFILLFLYLRNWLSDELALLGLFFFAFMTIHSYFFFYFHPWDRPSQLLWLILLQTFYARKTLLWIPVLIIAMLIKYDVLTFGIFYFFARISKTNWKRIVFNTTLICTLLLAMTLILENFFPDGIETVTSKEGRPTQLEKNWAHFEAYSYYFPPLLAWSLPWLLGWQQANAKDRHMRASVWYGYLLFLPYIVLVNFREVRAQLYLMFFLLPPMLISLGEILKQTGQATKESVDTPH